MNHAIIIGASKCGTTSMHYMLGQHPQVCLGDFKEPDFFGTNFRNYQTYSDIWPDWDPAKHKWALESTTSYTSHPTRYKQIPQIIQNYGIEPKLIYVMRDPWDRIESLMRFATRSTTPYLQVENNFIDGCDYYSRLEAYASVFGRHRIQVLQFEDLVADPNKTVNRVFDFLEISQQNIEPQWALKSQAQLPEEYLVSSYRKTRRHYVMQQLAPCMQQLADHWGVDVQRWGF